MGGNANDDITLARQMGLETGVSQEIVEIEYAPVSHWYFCIDFSPESFRPQASIAKTDIDAIKTEYLSGHDLSELLKAIKSSQSYRPLIKYPALDNPDELPLSPQIGLNGNTYEKMADGTGFFEIGGTRVSGPCWKRISYQMELYEFRPAILEISFTRYDEAIHRYKSGESHKVKLGTTIAEERIERIRQGQELVYRRARQALEVPTDYHLKSDPEKKVVLPAGHAIRAKVGTELVIDNPQLLVHLKYRHPFFDDGPIEKAVQSLRKAAPGSPKSLKLQDMLYFEICMNVNKRMLRDSDIKKAAALDATLNKVLRELKLPEKR